MLTRNTYRAQYLHERKDDLAEYFKSGEQSDTANIIGHEMKIPVQAILAYAELLQGVSDKSRDEYVKAILRNASRLKMLANNLSYMTKIDSGTLILKKETFDLPSMIIDIMHDFKNIMKLQNKRYVKIFINSQRHIMIRADKERLAQVILNLVDNAIKFTSKGNVSIKLDGYKYHVACSITDTGSGVDRTISSVLFNKFSTSSGCGTGLGLYICKNIIEAHGGKIWVESTNSGTTVTFTIPRRDQLKNYMKFLNSERVS